MNPLNRSPESFATALRRGAIAVAAALALLGQARAQSTISDASALSALPIAVSVAAPVILLSAGATLTIVAVEATSTGTIWVLERASDGARASVRLVGQGIAGEHRLTPPVFHDAGEPGRNRDIIPETDPVGRGRFPSVSRDRNPGRAARGDTSGVHPELRERPRTAALDDDVCAVDQRVQLAPSGLAAEIQCHRELARIQQIEKPLVSGTSPIRSGKAFHLHHARACGQQQRSGERACP